MRLNSVLVTFESEDEKATISRLLKDLNLPISEFITGKTEWQWTAGDSVSLPSEFPRDLDIDNKYDCGALTKLHGTASRFLHVKCKEDLGFICEKVIGNKLNYSFFTRN